MQQQQPQQRRWSTIDWGYRSSLADIASTATSDDDDDNVTTTDYNIDMEEEKNVVVLFDHQQQSQTQQQAHDDDDDEDSSDSRARMMSILVQQEKELQLQRGTVVSHESVTSSESTCQRQRQQPQRPLLTALNVWRGSLGKMFATHLEDELMMEVQDKSSATKVNRQRHQQQQEEEEETNNSEELLNQWSDQMMSQLEQHTSLTKVSSTDVPTATNDDDGGFLHWNATQRPASTSSSLFSKPISKNMNRPSSPPPTLTMSTTTSASIAATKDAATVHEESTNHNNSSNNSNIHNSFSSLVDSQGFLHWDNTVRR